MLKISQKQNTLNNRKNQALLDIRSVVEKRRGFVNEIVSYFLRFRHAPFIKLSNERIAHELGCSVRTVQRWTNWLHDQGYITKSQDNQFSINNYTLCKTLVYDTKYEAYINSLPEKNIDSCIDTFLLPETVTPNSSLFKFNVYFKPVAVCSSRMTYAHARDTVTDEIGKLTDRQQSYRLKRGVQLHMVKKEVRDWILKQKGQESLPAILRDEKIELVSPVMKQVISALKLKEVEYLKMIAFDEAVLQAAWQMVKKKNNLKSPMGYFMHCCLEVARQQGFTPEWHWYEQVCEILGVQRTIVDEEPDERPSDMYKRHEPSHGYPKAQHIQKQGLSASALAHIERKSWPVAKRHSWLKEEKSKIEKLIADFDSSKDFLSMIDNVGFLQRQLANVKEDIEIIERNYRNGN